MNLVPEEVLLEPEVVLEEQEMVLVEPDMEDILDITQIRSTILTEMTSFGLDEKKPVE